MSNVLCVGDWENHSKFFGLSGRFVGRFKGGLWFGRCTAGCVPGFWPSRGWGLCCVLWLRGGSSGLGLDSGFCVGLLVGWFGHGDCLWLGPPWFGWWPYLALAYNIGTYSHFIVSS